MQYYESDSILQCAVGLFVSLQGKCSVGSDGSQRISKLHKHGTEEIDFLRFQSAGDGVRQGGDCRSQITGVHIRIPLPFSLCAPGVRGHEKGESVP